MLSQSITQLVMGKLLLRLCMLSQTKQIFQRLIFHFSSSLLGAAQNGYLSKLMLLSDHHWWLLRHLILFSIHILEIARQGSRHGISIFDAFWDQDFTLINLSMWNRDFNYRCRSLVTPLVNLIIECEYFDFIINVKFWFVNLLSLITR